MAQEGIQELDVKSASGDVEAMITVKTQDFLSITSSSGDLDFSRLESAGDLWLETGSGDIYVGEM